MKNNQVGRQVRESGVIVSTVKPSYLPWYGKYETAISIDGGQWNWRIAEGYETLEDATKGHEKYSNMSDDELSKLKWIG